MAIVARHIDRRAFVVWPHRATSHHQGNQRQNRSTGKLFNSSCHHHCRHTNLSFPNQAEICIRGSTNFDILSFMQQVAGARHECIRGPNAAENFDLRPMSLPITTGAR